MSRRSNRAWRWRRWIARNTEPLWLARLEAGGETNWLIVEKPGRVRLCVEVFFSRRAQAEALVSKWRGKVGGVSGEALRQKAGPPVRVSDSLEIVHEPPGKTARAGRLHIPYGMAFGSGEHATTLMLLRALAGRGDCAGAVVLDAGTGSGVLALAARKLGAVCLRGIDFDPEAVRTARQNEALNFASPLVSWECADVKKLRAARVYSLIVANLFSGILCEAAGKMARALRKDGELWVSGILRTQQAEVAEAYRAAGLQLVKTTTRGKWVMQQWRW